MYLVLDYFIFALQSQEDLWLTAAQRLTAIIKQIIEFAKMVPGFMTRFNQEDQIVLLKRGKWHFLKIFEDFLLPECFQSKVTPKMENYFEVKARISVHLYNA